MVEATLRLAMNWPAMSERRRRESDGGGGSVESPASRNCSRAPNIRSCEREEPDKSGPLNVRGTPWT